jgi:hypothetical protein
MSSEACAAWFKKIGHSGPWITDAGCSLCIEERTCSASLLSPFSQSASGLIARLFDRAVQRPQGRVSSPCAVPDAFKARFR